MTVADCRWGIFTGFGWETDGDVGVFAWPLGGSSPVKVYARRGRCCWIFDSTVHCFNLAMHVLE